MNKLDFVLMSQKPSKEEHKTINKSYKLYRKKRIVKKKEEVVVVEPTPEEKENE
jgi:hypothetical protein